MKKVITLFMMSLTLATSIYAQVTFTFKGGVSWTNVSFDENINDQYSGDFDYEPKAGAIVGIASNIPLGGDRFSLQPEVLFHQKGYTSTYEDSELSDSYKTTLNYLEVPVMARVNFGKFYAAAGTYVGFGIGGKYAGSSSYLGYTTQHEGKVKFGKEPDNYAGSDVYVKTPDFGIQIGAGVKVSVFTIDLRYGLGLTDINEKRDLNTQTCNRSLQLTVGVPIQGKK